MHLSIAHEAPSRRGAGRRFLGCRAFVLILSFAVASTGSVLGLRAWMNREGVATGIPGLLAALDIQRLARRLPARGPETPTRIGFLGDSAVQGYPAGKDVATQLADVLNVRDPGRFQVVSLAYPGMGSLEYFSLAETILATDPDELVISFNLASMSRVARDFWARRELAGWIPLERLGDALRLPLLWWDVTLDRLLLYMSLVRLDLVGRWYAYRWEQIRAGHAISALRRRLQGIESPSLNGMPLQPMPYHPSFAKRFAEPYVRQNLGDAANGAGLDHPVLQMLAAAIDTFRSRGIEVLLYVTPTNVEHQERVGIDTRGGIAVTVATVRELARRHGAAFVDLHRMFPDAAFRDTGEHLTYEGAINGPRMIAERLADELRRGGRGTIPAAKP